MTIVEFIDARLAERLAAAEQALKLEADWRDNGYQTEYEWVRLTRRGTGGPASSMYLPGSPSPAEVKAQCEAMRSVINAAILDIANNDNDFDGCSPETIRADRCRYRSLGKATILRALAAIWSAHPDYRQDWAS